MNEPSSYRIRKERRVPLSLRKALAGDPFFDPSRIPEQAPEGREVLVLECGPTGEILGLALLDAAPPLLLRGEPIELSIAVVPGARGRGLGGLLLEEVKLIAAQRGWAGLTAVVQDGNGIARAFFRKEGFREEGAAARGFRRFSWTRSTGKTGDD